MFNDILTGKASMEPPKVQPDPYRAPSPPETTTLTCTSCGQTFPARQALAGVCRACAPTTMRSADLLMPDSISYRQGVEQERSKQARNLAFSIVVVVVIAIGFAFFRYAMREQYREDMKKASGYRSF